MADDYDNAEDIENMSDDELKSHVLAQLGSNATIDPADVTVRVSSGMVSLDGRVGTEEELRIIDHMLTDVIGLSDVDNEIVVDETFRSQSPEAIDDHLVDENETSGFMLGDMVNNSSPEADHVTHSGNPRRNLVEAGLADAASLDDDDFGTHDVNRAIEQAEPWIPPESPTPEGPGGREDGHFGIDGRR